MRFLIKPTPRVFIVLTDNKQVLLSYYAHQRAEMLKMLRYQKFFKGSVPTKKLVPPTLDLLVKETTTTPFLLS